MQVLNPYRNPSEASCFILGVKTAANVLGWEVVRTTEIGVIPSSLELRPVQPPPSVPMVTIEIPEEDPMLIEDKPIKKKTKKKIRIAKPNVGEKRE